MHQSGKETTMVYASCLHISYEEIPHIDGIRPYEPAVLPDDTGNLLRLNPHKGRFR